MNRFEGKIVLVTGSARGIGFAIARSFSREGAQVIILDLDGDSVGNAVDSLTAENLKADGLLCNVTDSGNVEKVFQDVFKKYGRIDVLINNAGITRDNLIMRMKESDWDAVIDVNLKGTFNCIQKISRIMLKQKSGVIINISSVIGLIGNAGQANYAASKGGVIALTKSTAKEFSSRNIRVNAVAPGFIKTDMTDKLPEEVVENYLKAIPSGKLGSVDDVSNLCLFLASDEASYITGQTISVDGGLTM